MMTHDFAYGARRALIAVAFTLSLVHLAGWFTTEPASAAPLQQPNEADLSVHAVTSPSDEVLVGRQFTYTLLVDNFGPITATNVVVTDTLVSSGLVDANGCSIAIRTTGGAIDEFTCNFALSQGVFDLGTFGANHLGPRGPGDIGRIIITINAMAERPTDLENTVTATSATPDPDFSNNTATTSLSVIEEADLRIHKFASPSPSVQAGEPFTYTLIVDNLGPSTARNVVVTDTLVASGGVDPNGCTLTVQTRGGPSEAVACNSALDSGVFDLATLGASFLNARGPNDAGRLVVTIHAVANQAVVMENLTTVTADSYDPDLANNHAVTTLAVTDAADLQIQVFGPPAGEANTGDELNFLIVVDNLGPNPAREVGVVQEVLGDASLDVTAITPDVLGNQPTAQCTPSAPVAGFTHQSIDCSLGNAMDALTAAAQVAGSEMPSPKLLAAANGTSRWAIEVTVQADHPAAVTSLASAYGIQRDPAPENNDASLQSSVVCKRDGATELGLTKTVKTDDSVTAGSPLTYTLDYTNFSTQTAYCASLVEEVPPYTTFSAPGSTSGWTCIDGAPAGLPCTFDLGTLASGATGQVTFVARVLSSLTESVTIENSASIESSIPEGITANNVAGADVEAMTPPGIMRPHYLPALQR